MAEQTAASPLDWASVFRPMGEKLASQLGGALKDLRLSEEAQGRYEALASRNTEGTLTEAERVELGEFVALNRMVSILKIEAAISLRNKAAA